MFKTPDSRSAETARNYNRRGRREDGKPKETAAANLMSHNVPKWAQSLCLVVVVMVMMIMTIIT
jgi:hypothetical protein